MRARKRRCGNCTSYIPFDPSSQNSNQPIMICQKLKLIGADPHVNNTDTCFIHPSGFSPKPINDCDCDTKNPKKKDVNENNKKNGNGKKKETTHRRPRKLILPIR